VSTQYSILIPTIHYDTAKVAAHIQRRTAGRDHQYSIVVVAEGAKPIGGAVMLKEAAGAGHVKPIGEVGRS
jgi:ATP-dependent phosphofructokinase / diphosphate-dependent phosphofructokinase